MHNSQECQERHPELELCDQEIKSSQVATEQQRKRGHLLSDHELNAGLVPLTATCQNCPSRQEGGSCLPLAPAWQDGGNGLNRVPQMHRLES